MAFLSTRIWGSTYKPLFGNLISSLGSLRLSSKIDQKRDDHKNLVSAESSKIDYNTENTNWKGIFHKVNNLLSSDSNGRLFAVVHLCGKQFKVTPGDIILVEGYWPPTTGDHIRLEKVLLVGGNDFTLFGRPVLEPGLVDVQATVIEKTLTHTKTHFKKKRRKQYTRINFQRSPNTMIRVNSIQMSGKVNEPKSDSNPARIF